MIPKELNFALCDMLRQASDVLHIAIENGENEKVRAALQEGATEIIKNVLTLLTEDPEEE